MYYQLGKISKQKQKYSLLQKQKLPLEDISCSNNIGISLALVSNTQTSIYHLYLAPLLQSKRTN
ncbi:hypothetical protein TTHERM_00362960 (macronuclear) [Tetrahymena thermophila SB210]|uniref:Uncharacterized protein n=1 Tax=Tetrahymena thermophila (strain SB210) TaxID=312017 RepID=Q22PE7_TETTS|nr:hypothetical protein TTHERM_00362960 [Tetrahymena thermophila SB210]EAR87162.1 hypothetical protein TTHERM_00362960 [Tetrahymena thermophila SB210]|eukprot:XP_001007407.1 hypothetical protein TTHERM_00362960 [Tetrahymena thermophila SB210]